MFYVWAHELSLMILLVTTTTKNMLEDIHPSTFNYILNCIRHLANGYTKNVDLPMSQK